MPLRSLIASALLIAAALPALAQTDTPEDYGAPPIIWVDSYDDIPEPRPVACIGNSSAMYCHAADGNVYAVQTGLTAGRPGAAETAIQGGYAPAPSAGGAAVLPRD